MTMTEQVLYWGDIAFKAQVLQYQCAKPTNQSVLILPPTGGTNYIDRGYAEILCKNGFDVVILERWSDDDEFSLDLEIHERFYERAQKAIGIALENIKTPFVGVLGTSIGAIHTAIAVPRFEKINAAFSITGGAELSNIIALSEQSILVDVRKKRFKIHGYKNDEEYIEALKPHIPYEPMKMPLPAKKPSLGMVLAMKDTVVPTYTQNLLRQLWSPQTVLEIPSNHTCSIVNTWLFQRQKIVDFFRTAALGKM